jgi:DNA-binding transcriptional LysR family regulator
LIDKLEFLLALSRTQHFGKAAEACGVTQPTLSAGVQALEAQLGVRLVNRGSRFIGFTDEGARVLGWARQIVAAQRGMHDDLRTLRQGLSGNVRIGVIPTALAMVPALTTPFLARHPGVHFTINSLSSFDILHMLENLEIEAGLTYLEEEPLGRVRAIPLFRERYRLVTAAHLPLGDRSAVSWRDLAGLDLCLLTRDMQNRRILDRLLARDGASHPPVLESNSIVTLLAHVRTGHWASILPESLAELAGAAGPVRSIPIVDPDVTQTIGLVFAHHDPATPLCSALAEEAEKRRIDRNR